MLARPWSALASLSLLASCGAMASACDTSQPKKPAALDAASATSAGSAQVAKGPPSMSAPTASVSVGPRPVGTAPAAALDAGRALARCTRAAPPVGLGRSGPVALDDAGSVVHVVRNRSGAPDVVRLPKASKGDNPAPTALAELSPAPCVLGGKYTYCQDRAGIIRAYDENVPAPFVLSAVAAPGYRIAASRLGRAHSFVAYLAEANTTEGKMLQAFGVLDHGSPVRLSDDGAGATVLGLSARVDGAVVVSFDARAAMMPMHARTVQLQGDAALKLGPDSVLGIFGPPERGFAASVGSTVGGETVVLCPMPKDTVSFGLAAVPITELKADVAPTWSMYPNGLDPAPLAASQGGPRLYVARVRPSAPTPKSPLVLELGHLDATFAFVPLAVVDAKHAAWDLALLPDGDGVWLAYSDNAATTVEHFSCK